MANRLLPVNLLLASLIAAAAGMIVSDVAAYRVAHLFSAAPGKEGTAAPAASAELSAYAPILEKGLFGKATVGKLTPVTAAAVPAAAGSSPHPAPVDLVLLGTAIGSFRETFALVRKTGTGEERVFRLGENVFGSGPLLRVDRESIVISAGGKKQTITTPSAGGTAPPPAGATPAPGHGSSPLATSVGAGNFIVDQRGLNAALDNIGQAMSDARLLPYMKEGKVEGFRVAEVKPQGIFGMIGIRNGDVLLRVNDFAIDSPERAIQSLASLKGQSRVKLDLVRDGQPSTMTYDIR